LSLLAAKRGDELAGVLPVVVHNGVVSAPVNWHTPLFEYLARDAEAGAALAESLMSRAAVRADLGFLAPDDPGVTYCRAAAEHLGRGVIVRTITRSPFVEIEGGDWDRYRSSLDRNVRKNIGRRLRRLGEHGTVSLQVADGLRDLDSLLHEGFRLEASGWKRERATAIASDPVIERFYTEIARWATERGWLAMRFLRVDGTAIAFSLCLQASGIVYALKSGYDPAFRRFGPGILLTYESLRDAFERGLRSYELLGDEEPYKLMFSSSVRDRVRFQAFGRSLRGRVNQFAWSHGRAAARRARGIADRLTAPRSAATGRSNAR
jgi:CelD/BcsL family acetyltransferase involved in cellulose biosynthesis